MTEKEKYRQIRKEAGYTALALAVLIVFWAAAGFGLAQVEARFLHLPLWVWTSTFGVWGMAMLLVRLLTAHVFADMELDGSESEPSPVEEGGLRLEAAAGVKGGGIHG